MKNILMTLPFLLSALFAEHNATYIGDKACVSCHAKEVKEWKGSDHELAMQIADENTVQADFNNTTFTYNGMISTFFKKNEKFMVRTEGADGQLHTYEIAYTFGVYPLQQYMINFPNGKIQVLDPTWDTRSKEEGGQRWYHIHKDENVSAGDPLHWTGPNMNWNYMCADCHSTNLKKNYDEKSRSYHTTFDSINVSCEACHGPASKHIDWSKTETNTMKNRGFQLSLKYKKGKWDTNSTSHKTVLTDKEVEVCAKCHSRRSQLDDDFMPGDKFSDHYLAVLLEENLYFPDGKIQDEVYVYDSFLQSKMYEKGVTCTDCHNPHTLKRRAVGDKVCSQCHKEEKYTAAAHHKHQVGSTGSSCIGCHMPARLYMGVDSRNDHSFRVPRPDVSVEMKEVPNACTLCHTDKEALWAADAMKKWYGKIPVGKQNFAHDLQALRTNDKDAPKSLYRILTSTAPTIAKATASTYLGAYPSRQTYMTTLQMLRRSDAMTRRAGLIALESFPPKIRIKETFKMLHDPVKIVRMEAARQLASFPKGQMTESQKKLLKNGLDEYEMSLHFTAERPESQLSLGLFYSTLKMPEKAEKAYKEALYLQSQFVPAYINYSNFLMQEGKFKKAFEILTKGIQKVPEVGILYHALGLWYVRNKESNKANNALKRAMELDKNNARFAYVYAISVGKNNPKNAIDILEEVYLKHKGDLQIVSGLIYYYKQVGDTDKRTFYEKRLKALQNFSVR